MKISKSKLRQIIKEETEPYRYYTDADDERLRDKIKTAGGYDGLDRYVNLSDVGAPGLFRLEVMVDSDDIEGIERFKASRDKFAQKMTRGHYGKLD